MVDVSRQAWEAQAPKLPGERMEVELKCRALQVECGNLKKALVEMGDPAVNVGVSENGDPSK